ncbi:hypothetical protein DFJ73DRAFT_798005 [Zopfochytrium polystomum]|nr:hypothetical protein DFJ73DRAFT_798005 [Zopfochytrium polystomum]
MGRSSATKTGAAAAKAEVEAVSVEIANAVEDVVARYLLHCQQQQQRPSADDDDYAHDWNNPATHHGATDNDPTAPLPLPAAAAKLAALVNFYEVENAATRGSERGLGAAVRAAVDACLADPRDIDVVVALLRAAARRCDKRVVCECAGRKPERAALANHLDHLFYVADNAAGTKLCGDAREVGATPTSRAGERSRLRRVEVAVEPPAAAAASSSSESADAAATSSSSSSAKKSTRAPLASPHQYASYYTVLMALSARCIALDFFVPAYISEVVVWPVDVGGANPPKSGSARERDSFVVGSALHLLGCGAELRDAAAAVAARKAAGGDGPRPYEVVPEDWRKLDDGIAAVRDVKSPEAKAVVAKARAHKIKGYPASLTSEELFSPFPWS